MVGRDQQELVERAERRGPVAGAVRLEAREPQEPLGAVLRRRVRRGPPQRRERVEAAGLGVQPVERAERGGEVRRDPERLLVVVDGARRIAEALLGDPGGLRERRGSLDRGGSSGALGPEHLDEVLVVAARPVDAGERVERGEVRGREGQRLAVRPDRVVDPAHPALEQLADAVDEVGRRCRVRRCVGLGPVHRRELLPPRRARRAAARGRAARGGGSVRRRGRPPTPRGRAPGRPGARRAAPRAAAGSRRRGAGRPRAPPGGGARPRAPRSARAGGAPRRARGARPGSPGRSRGSAGSARPPPRDRRAAPPGAGPSGRAGRSAPPGSAARRARSRAARTAPPSDPPARTAARARSAPGRGRDRARAPRGSARARRRPGRAAPPAPRRP